jgi:hypothetical protein
MPQLNMPLFVTAADVIERMQLNADLDGIQDVVENAIMSAELQIEALLGGQLTRKSRTNVFYLDGEAFSSIYPNGTMRMEIPSGLIRQDTPVTVSASLCNIESYGVLEGGVFGNPFGSDDGPFGTFDTVDPTWYKVDYDKGYVLIHAMRYRNRYIQITCDTGFEPGTNPLPITGLPDYDDTVQYQINDLVALGGISYIALTANLGVAPSLGVGVNWALAFQAIEQLPQPLYEAIISYVPSVFDSSQSTNRNREALDQYRKAQNIATSLLKPYLRMVGFLFRPVW